MTALHDDLTIDPRDLEFRFVRSAGPGGQNVNKVSTAVELRFDVRGSSLPPPVKARLLKRMGRKVSETGVLVLRSRTYRTQLANRNEALRRLGAILQDAAKPTKRRIGTRPSGASKNRRLQDKKKRSQLKQLRRSRASAE